ncbi:MAG: hypothetical protein ABEI86_07965 [Halobacteriaceae archaeon]
MSETESSQLEPKDAARVVRRETNKVYNPVVSTEEVAEELSISPDKARDLLSQVPRLNPKEIGDTQVWW